jgi:hypothetical protein
MKDKWQFVTEWGITACLAADPYNDATPDNHDELIVTVHCVGCGRDRTPNEMGINPTQVYLRDNTETEILLCDKVCADFWDGINPGEYTQLDDGTEVKQALWQCMHCDSVVDCNSISMRVDLDYVDLSNPTCNPQDSEYSICNACVRKERKRFQTLEEVKTLLSSPRCFICRKPLTPETTFVHKWDFYCPDDVPVEER